MDQMLPKLSTILALSGCTFIIQLFLAFSMSTAGKTATSHAKNRASLLENETNFQRCVQNRK